MNPQHLTVLFIEDNANYVSFLREMLRGDGSPFSLCYAERMDEGLKRLAQGGIEVVLLDINLPDCRGLASVQKVRAAAPNVPIVVLTAVNEEPLAVKALEAGAQDYLIKGREDRFLLERYIRFALERHRKLAEVEAGRRQSESDAASFLQVIIRNADGIMIVDRNGVIRFANPAVGLIFGKKSEDFVGTPFGFPIVEGQTTEMDISRPAGSDSASEIVSLEMRVAATEWHGESAYIASLRDITKLKKTARSLMSANRKLQELQEIDRLKSTFVSNVSHELRTPLTVITSSANNMADGLFGALNEAQTKWIKKIQSHAQHLHDLISDVLDLSKLESGKAEMQPEWVDMAALIEGLVSNIRPLTEQKRLSLSCHLPKGLPVVWAGKSRITQVLTNLIANAAKFTPAEGTVRVTALHEKDDIQVAVLDTGIGIAPEHREVIFERFKQVDGADISPTKGIGLGLAICAEIMAQHHGRIWVESELGKGSRFIFRFPVDFRRRQAAAAQARTVLVVDDDPHICDLLAVVLSQKGCQVAAIKNGLEAKAAIEDPGRMFDAVFLDLMMPGTNGLELLRLLRKTHPHTPIVILTAYPKSDLGRECLEHGVTVITKPFDIDDIQKIAHDLLGRAQKSSV